MTSFLHHQIQAFVIALASSTDNFLVGLSIGWSHHKILECHLLWIISFCNALGSFVATYVGSQADEYVSWIVQSVSSSSTTTPSSIVNAATIQFSLAGMAFLYLAYKEYKDIPDDYHNVDDDENKNDDDNEPSSSMQIQQQQQLKHNNNEKATKTSSSSAWQVAFPMTLNNLAGGVATGVAGVSPLTACIYVLFVSSLVMWVGYLLGSRNNNNKKASSKYLTCSRKKNDQPTNEVDSNNINDYEQQRQARRAARWSIMLYCYLAFQSFYNAFTS